MARGDLVTARASLQRALALDPELDAARADLAEVARRGGKLDDAIAHTRYILGRHPRSPKLLSALGALLIERGELGAAIDTLGEAHRLAPDFVPALENLSRALFGARRFAEAVTVEHSLLEREPDAVRLHLRLAHALLMEGRLDEGWAEYEWRLRQPGFEWGTKGLPRWDGSDPARLAIRVVTEQGLGDAMLFARFVREMARRSRRVQLLCRPQLERLFRSSFESESVRVTADADEDLASLDAHIHLLSLPYALGLGTAAVTRDSGYLRPDPVTSGLWRRRMAGASGLKVGLAWAGNPERSGDESRSLTAKVVAPLGDAGAGITWFSLQADVDASAPRPFDMVDCMGSVADYADTAAIIGALDLVVSVDTSVAHAAAGAGTPLWLLAPHNLCWRWDCGGVDSPWYSGVRLFRAERPGAWAPAIASIRASLVELKGEL